MTLNPFPYIRIAQKSIGIIWLSSITFFIAILDLYLAKLSIFQTISIGTAILAITGILLARGINSLCLAKKRLPDQKSEYEILRRHYIRKRLLIIFILEIAGLSIATVALLKLHYYQYIVPYDIVIITWNFFPLSRILVMPVYYFLGIILSLIGLLTMFFVPASLQIGNLIAIIAIPSLSFVFLSWIIIVFILREVMKYLSKI